MAITANFTLLLDTLALISIPILASFLFYNKIAFKIKVNLLTNYTKRLFLNYLSIGVLAISLLSIGITLAVHLFSVVPTSIHLRNYAYDIFILLSSFSPILIFLLIICFPVKLLINGFIIGIKTKNNNGKDNSLHSKDKIIRPRNKVIYLLFFTLLSITISLIPHSPTINKDQLIGSDTKEYADMVNMLIKSSNIHQFIRQSFEIQSSGDRPLTLIFLYTIVKIIDTNPTLTIEYLPILLAPALIFVVYLLTSESTSNDVTSILGAF